MYVSIASVLGAFLVAGAALAWLNHSLSEETGKVVEKHVVLAQYSQTVDLLADLKKVAPLVVSYQDKINLLLPRKDDLLEFPRWLNGLSRANKVSLGNFAFQGATVAEKDTDAGYLGFTLDVAGPLDGIGQFFREIELHSSRFLVGIDNFDVSQADGAARALVRGRVFFR